MYTLVWLTLCIDTYCTVYAIYVVCRLCAGCEVSPSIGGPTEMRKKTMQLREKPLVYPRYPERQTLRHHSSHAKTDTPLAYNPSAVLKQYADDTVM